jgi:heme-degrading monooxygenase HmoA
MPTIAWTRTAHEPHAAQAGSETGTADESVVVQVSRLELGHLRSVPGFLIAALRLRRDVLRADGALGVSLRAHPLRRTFWTLSAWTGPDAIAAFTRSDAHRDVMVRYRTKMHGSHFHTWFPGDAGEPPSWPDATARLEASRHD